MTNLILEKDGQELSRKDAAQVRYINELIEELGLPPMVLDIPAKDEQGNDVVIPICFNPKLLDFLISNENRLKRQILRDREIREADPSDRMVSVKPLYYTVNGKQGVGVLASTKDNELLVYYFGNHPNGVSVTLAFEAIPIVVFRRLRYFAKQALYFTKQLTFILQGRAESRKDYLTKPAPSNLELSDLSNFIRFPDEPQAPVFQQAQETLEFLGMPPMIYMDSIYMDSIEEETDPGSPELEATRVIERLKSLKPKIIAQLAQDGYIREMESGNSSAYPLYWCQHKKYGLGVVQSLANSEQGLRIAFFKNSKFTSSVD